MRSIWWNDYYKEVMGKSESEVNEIIRDSLKQLTRGVGYDEPAQAFVANFELFMGSRFSGFPIIPNLTVSDLEEKTFALKNGMEHAFPPEDLGWKQKWEYYGPAFKEVEKACGERNLDRIKEAINNLIDLKVHD